MARGMKQPSPVPTKESKPALSMAASITTLSLSTPVINQVIPLPTTAPRNLFTRRNLYQWRQFVDRTLRPTKLDSHLVNSKLEEEDAHYFKWPDEEDILLTWLLDFMKPEVGDQIIDYDSVKDMWDAVIELYSKLEDESRMADFNKRAMELL